MNRANLARGLFLAGAVPFLALGLLHALASIADSVSPRRIVPADEHVTRSMAASGLRLTGRTSVWRAWLGFNISHGLGVAFFGGVLMLLAVRDFSVVTRVGPLIPLAIAMSLAYLVLSLRFWFYAPAIGTGLGAACFVLSYLVLKL